jgi:hypothetical protein
LGSAKINEHARRPIEGNSGPIGEIGRQHVAALPGDSPEGRYF